MSRNSQDSDRSKAIRLMGLLNLMRREENYVKRLRKQGKPFSHRKTILKTIEREVAYE